MMAKIIQLCHYARNGWAPWHKWVFATSGLPGEDVEMATSFLLLLLGDSIAPERSEMGPFRNQIKINSL
jgi:hypothetical protein